MSTQPAKLTSSPRANLPAAYFIFATALIFAGCGAPGEPIPPSPPVAATVTDLSAHQAGDGVFLAFTMPVRATSGDRLTDTPAIEILRGSTKPDGSPDTKSLRVVDNIPGSMVGKYVVDDKFRFIDPVSPEESKSHLENPYSYAVRSRLSPKRASANSNVVTVSFFAVPEKVSSVEARVTESAIELRWPSVSHTSAGDVVSVIPSYNVYRVELTTTAADAANRDLSQLGTGTNLQLLASAADPAYEDKSFEFGKTYAYIVRSVGTITGGPPVESSDSIPIVVTPRDTFPPAAPRDVSAAVLPGETEGSLLIELSWSINTEPDFAGYRIYRSEQEGDRGELLPSELLLAPAYRDTSVQSAHRYWYRVTAVDRAGNESAASPPVAAEVAQP